MLNIMLWLQYDGFKNIIICKICKRDTEDLTSITNPDNAEELGD